MWNPDDAPGHLHLVNLDAIREAAARTRPHVRRTPAEPSAALDQASGATTVLKLENQQVTGCFKARGPLNRMLTMSEEERRRGVVAATAGNHGLGVSYAGRRLGVPVHVHVPRHADPDKLAMLRGYGATLYLADSWEAAHHAALAMAAGEGLTFLSAYNDPWVIASNGVVGLELLDDVPDLDLVIVPVGGGGLIAGIASALTGLRPGVEVWGVEAAVSPTFNHWHRQGATGLVEVGESVAEGLAGYVEPETITWPIIRDRVKRMLTATEAELVLAMRWMVTRHRMIVEPSGAAGLAAALAAGSELAGRRVAVIISGGNVAWSRFLGLVVPGSSSQES